MKLNDYRKKDRNISVLKRLSIIAEKSLFPHITIEKWQLFSAKISPKYWPLALGPLLQVSGVQGDADGAPGGQLQQHPHPGHRAQGFRDHREVWRPSIIEIIEWNLSQKITHAWSMIDPLCTVFYPFAVSYQELASQFACYCINLLNLYIHSLCKQIFPNKSFMNLFRNTVRSSHPTHKIFRQYWNQAQLILISFTQQH